MVYCNELRFQLPVIILIPGRKAMKDFVSETCRVAVVQVKTAMFDKKRGTQIAVDAIREAGRNGAELIVFPESFLPCYPYGMTFGFTVGARTADGRADWMVYYENSLLVPGPETFLIAEAAKEAGAWVSIGITERDALNATLYCTNLIFSPDGRLAAKHRKLKPTGAERVIWGDGQEGAFPVVETPWGPMGSLICWENYMPLARVALYEKGISLYLAPNTNDNPEWQDTIRHIAIEGHCYFVNCDMYFTRDMYPADLNEQDEIAKLPVIACRGGSNVIDPFGHPVTDTLWDQEGVLYATLDMQKVPASRMECDAVGHYSRPDVLDLRVLDR